MYHPSLLLKRTLFLKTQLSEANFLPSDHSKRFTHNTRPSGKNGVSAPLRPLSLRRFPLFARDPGDRAICSSFAGCTQQKSPRIGAPAKRKWRVKECVWGGGGERRRLNEWLHPARPPNAPERWITANWHLEACGICLFMCSFPV